MEGIKYFKNNRWKNLKTKIEFMDAVLERSDGQISLLEAMKYCKESQK
jgi:hypothetical protein